MSSFAFYLNEEEEPQHRQFYTIYRNIREKFNLLDLPENQFRKFFRLNKEGFMFLLQEFQKYLKPNCRSDSLAPITKLLAVLKFFATGAYQKCVGNDNFVGMDQSTFSRSLDEILIFFANVINKQWIKFEESNTSLIERKLEFYNAYALPGVIGVVDGTHVRILKPAKNIQHLYYNRKGFYSINVMLVCDSNLKILYVDARHAGSSHDSFIWNQSGLDSYLRTLHQRGDRNSWIIGDCGYPLKSYLLTPYKNLGNNNDSEHRQKQVFNKHHAKCRNVIERLNGVLKNRFRVILGERQLHYNPKKCSEIINAVCSLHNICKYFKVPEEVNDDEVNDDEIDDNDNDANNNDDVSHNAPDTEAEATRRRVMYSL